MNAMNFLLLMHNRLTARLARAAKLLLAQMTGPTPTPAVTVARLHPLVLQGLPAPRRAPACTRARPLRVLRVMEPDQQRSSVGRMVISGSMADVCAELDRLAAREAALG